MYYKHHAKIINCSKKLSSFIAGKKELTKQIRNLNIQLFPESLFWSNSYLFRTVVIPDFISLEIIDLNGRVVAGFADNKFVLEKYNFCWNGGNTDDQRQPSGIYYVVLKTGNKIWTRNVILL